MRVSRIVGGLVIAVLLANGALAGGPVIPTINEFNYDNDGTDNTEYVEIYAAGGGDFSAYDLVHYNGSNGSEVNRTNLGTIPADGFLIIGTTSTVVPNWDITLFGGGTNLIQNGAPDGLALVLTGGACVEFLSYEGDFTALASECNGTLSSDIGVFDIDPSGSGTNPQDEVILQRFPNGTGPFFATSDGIDAGIYADGTPGVTNTPEPGSLALICLGAVALMRRRSL